MNNSKAIPYYIGMAIYLGINAFIYFCQNQTVTGSLSDVYLGASTLCGFLAGVTVLYALMEDDGEDSSEADVEFLGVTLHKTVWYVGVLGAIGARLYFAYQSNHNATGAESVWGYAWFVGSLILLLMTFPNATAYFKKRIRITQQKKMTEKQNAVKSS